MEAQEKRLAHVIEGLKAYYERHKHYCVPKGEFYTPENGSKKFDLGAQLGRIRQMDEPRKTGSSAHARARICQLISVSFPSCANDMKINMFSQRLQKSLRET